MRRKVLAGLLGGLAAFVWSSISHTVLPLGGVGLSTLPDEKRVIESLRERIPEEGLYLFPLPDPDDTSPEAQEEWMERYRTGPAGLLVYRPVGGELNFPFQLAIELLATLAGAVVVASILAGAPMSLGQGAALGAAFGVFAWLSLSLSYWNWYHFPTAFVLAEGLDQAVGWSLAGAVIAMVYRRKPAPA